MQLDCFWKADTRKIKDLLLGIRLLRRKLLKKKHAYTEGCTHAHTHTHTRASGYRCEILLSLPPGCHISVPIHQSKQSEEPKGKCERPHPSVRSLSRCRRVKSSEEQRANNTDRIQEIQTKRTDKAEEEKLTSGFKNY